MEEVSEYEKLRLKNIKEREKIYQEMLDQKNLLSNSKKKRRSAPVVKKEKEVLPPRKSLRLSEGKVKSVKRYTPGDETDHDPIVSLDTHNAQEILVPTMKNKAEEVACAERFFTDFSDNLQTGTVQEVDTDICAERIFKLTDRFMNKDSYTLSKVCSVDINPTEHKVLISAGDMSGRLYLGMLDITDPDDEKEEAFFFAPHREAIVEHSWDRFNAENLITTSYDGTMRIFDIRRLQSRILYGDRHYCQVGGGCYQHTQKDQNVFLVSKGLGHAEISVVDKRKGTKSAKDFHLDNCAVYMSSIDIHPVNRDLFMAASGDGDIKIFDLRQEGRYRGHTDSVRQPAHLTELQNLVKADTRAHFSPHTGNKVISTTASTSCFNMKLFNTENMNIDLIQHSSEVVWSLDKKKPYHYQKGVWHPRNDNLYLKTGEDVSKGGKTLQAWKCSVPYHLTRLWDLRLEKNVTMLAMHPTLEIIIGFGYSGHMAAFM